MPELLKPVLVRAREAVIEETKIEAENSAINMVLTRLAAQQGHQGTFIVIYM